MTQTAKPIAATMAHRRARTPDLAAENEALHALARQPIDDPQSTLETAIEMAMNLCRADSVGIGLFETLADGTTVFRWAALCGALASAEPTIAPCNLSPGDTAIQGSGPQLYARPELYFTYLHHPQLPIFEGMQLPLRANDRLLGTFWLLSHHQQRQFDRTDERLMVSLGGFAAAALQRLKAAKPDTSTIRPGFDTATAEILESLSDAVVCLDGEWRIAYANQAFARINNLQPQEIIGKTHWEIWPSSAGTIVEQTYRQVVADQVAAHFEVLYEPLKMWLEIHAYPARAGLSIYFRDITDRKLAENALQESEEFSRSVFESSADCLKVLDINGCLLSMNGPGRCLMEIEDCTRLVGTSWIEFWPDSDRAKADRAVKTAVAGGTGRFSGYCPTAKKTPKWWEVVVTPILDVAGNPKHLLVTSRDVTDRKLADDALRQMSGELQQQLQKFDAIASSIPDFIYTFDLSGRFTYINPSQLELWQKTEAEVVGKNFFDLDYPPELATKLLHQIQQVIETRQPLRDESQYTSVFGTRTYEYIFFPLSNSASGIPEAVAGVARDITDRQQAEAALRDSEQKFRNMADNAPFMVWVTDPAGYCHYLSQSWYDFTGQTPETGLGFGWLNAAHPIDRESAQQAFLAANDRQEAFRLEYRLRRSDGEYIWAIDAASPWFGVEGEFKGYIGSVIDIDDRKQAESALRLSEERYRTLFESMDQGFCVIEVLFDEQDRAIDYHFLETNPTFDRHSGLVQVEGKMMRDLAPNHEEYWFEIYGNVARTGEPIRFEHRAAALNRWFDVYAFGIGLPQSRQVGVLFKDISDRQRVEAEREQLLQREQAAREAAENANRIKDEFLAVLSHELRSPLNPILGWSRLLQTGRLDASKTAVALATIERNAKLQASLIEDLLDVSRILQGKLGLNATAVNLASTIQAAIETVRLAAEAKSIELDLDIDPNVRFVSGDATRLQQVMWNLLSNAVKFTDSGGRVEIRLTQSEGDRAEIAIRDNGKGIPKDFLPYVFDYFRQADSATTRQFGGLGLGLAIVRHLVELHGGTIVADSQGEGQGATFTVTLPLQPIGAALGGAEQFSESTPNLQGVRVLVVDDDSDTRDFVVFVLEAAGASVTSATSAGEAFAALTRVSPDLLLSDIGMPELDGYTLIRQVRALPPDRGGQIPAIALTAYAGSLNQKQALAAGFGGHLTKPIEPNQLVGAIVTLLGKLRR